MQKKSRIYWYSVWSLVSTGDLRVRNPAELDVSAIDAAVYYKMNYESNSIIVNA